MKQKLISFVHQPKKVVTVSLIIAFAIGIFGYIKINQKPADLYNPNLKTDVSIGNTSASQNLTLGFLSGGRIKTVSVKAGDFVRKGEVLATLDAGNVLGSLMQSKAALATAKANYDKIINGATGVAIDVAKATVHTAQVSLDGITKQQDILVKNAYKNLLNSTPEAIPDGSVIDYTAPIISGNYTKGLEGKINLSLYYTNNGANFSVSGIVNGNGSVNAATPQPIGDSGLYIRIPSNTSLNVTNWIIEIPNKKAANYIANNNAYQAALETQSQTVKNAQASLDQANASLSALVAAARPEDLAVGQAQVDSAQGAVEIAQSAYNNTIITAPSNGTVINVSIAPGQIAIPNAQAIQFLSNN